MMFTEMWLNDCIPVIYLELEGHAIFRAQRITENFSKTKGGGLYIYVNNSWYTDRIITENHCPADLEYLMIKSRPFAYPEHSHVLLSLLFMYHWMLMLSDH